MAVPSTATTAAISSVGPRAARPPATSYERVRRLYAGYARDYDRRFAAYSRVTLARAVRALGEAPPERVVDVACGTGLLAERVLGRWPGASLIGVDLSAEMLACAAARLPEREGAVSWRVGRAERLPVESGWADTVVCTNAFHLVQDARGALAEFRRVVRPGGRLVIVDWCADFATMRILVPVLRVVRRQERCVRTLAGLGRELEEAGFRVRRAERFVAGPVWGLMTLAATADGRSPSRRGSR